MITCTNAIERQLDIGIDRLELEQKSFFLLRGSHGAPEVGRILEASFCLSMQWNYLGHLPLATISRTNCVCVHVGRQTGCSELA